MVDTSVLPPSVEKNIKKYPTTPTIVVPPGGSYTGDTVTEVYKKKTIERGGSGSSVEGFTPTFVGTPGTSATEQTSTGTIVQTAGEGYITKKFVPSAKTQEEVAQLGQDIASSLTSKIASREMLTTRTPTATTTVYQQLAEKPYGEAQKKTISQLKEEQGVKSYAGLTISPEDKYNLEAKQYGTRGTTISPKGVYLEQERAESLAKQKLGIPLIAVEPSTISTKPATPITRGEVSIVEKITKRRLPPEIEGLRQGEDKLFGLEFSKGLGSGLTEKAGTAVIGSGLVFASSAAQPVVEFFRAPTRPFSEFKEGVTKESVKRFTVSFGKYGYQTVMSPFTFAEETLSGSSLTSKTLLGKASEFGGTIFGAEIIGRGIGFIGKSYTKSVKPFKENVWLDAEPVINPRVHLENQPPVFKVGKTSIGIEPSFQVPELVKKPVLTESGKLLGYKEAIKAGQQSFTYGLETGERMPIIKPVPSPSFLKRTESGEPINILTGNKKEVQSKLTDLEKESFFTKESFGESLANFQLKKGMEGYIKEMPSIGKKDITQAGNILFDVAKQPDRTFPKSPLHELSKKPEAILLRKKPVNQKTLYKIEVSNPIPIKVTPFGYAKYLEAKGKIKFNPNVSQEAMKGSYGLFRRFYTKKDGIIKPLTPEIEISSGTPFEKRQEVIAHELIHYGTPTKILDKKSLIPSVVLTPFVGAKRASYLSYRLEPAEIIAHSNQKRVAAEGFYAELPPIIKITKYSDLIKRQRAEQKTREILSQVPLVEKTKEGNQVSRFGSMVSSDLSYDWFDIQSRKRNVVSSLLRSKKAQSATPKLIFAPEGKIKPPKRFSTEPEKFTEVGSEGYKYKGKPIVYSEYYKPFIETRPNIVSSPFLGTSSAERFKPIQETKFNIKPELIQPGETVTILPSEKTNIKPRLMPITREESISISKLVSRSKNKFKEPEPTPEEPTKKLPDMFLTKKEFKLGKAYNVYIKKGKEFVKIGGDLTKGRALKLGSSETLRSLRATFKLKEVGTTSAADIAYQPSTKFFKESRTVKGREVATPLTFIQRRGTRLSTAGEIGEIKSARQLAQAKFKFGGI